MQPEPKPLPINMTLTLPADLHRALTDMARKEYRSLKGQIVYMLQREVDAQQQTNGATDEQARA